MLYDGRSRLRQRHSRRTSNGLIDFKPNDPTESRVPLRPLQRGIVRFGLQWKASMVNWATPLSGRCAVIVNPSTYAKWLMREIPRQSTVWRCRSGDYLTETKLGSLLASAIRGCLRRRAKVSEGDHHVDRAGRPGIRYLRSSNVWDRSGNRFDIPSPTLGQLASVTLTADGVLGRFQGVDRSAHGRSHHMKPSSTR